MSALRIIHCKTCQEGLYLIRNTPFDTAQMLLLLNDIETSERDGIFDKWDINDLKNAWLLRLYPDQNAVRERMLSCVQSDRVHMDKNFLLRVATLLLK